MTAMRRSRGPPSPRRGVSGALSTQEGFTLVEALAALTVVGAVLVTTLAAVGADVRSSRAVEQAQEMAAAARTALQRVEQRPRDDLLDREDGWTSLGAPLDGYRWRAEASPVRGRPGLLDVQVTVRGPDGGRESMSTLLFRSPPDEDEGP